jgi:hypothetical protein
MRVIAGVAALTKKWLHHVVLDYGYEYDFWLVRKCKLSKQCIEHLTGLLASLANSYRLMVGAADEFNRVSLAKRSDVEDAIHRASDLGEIIDDVLKRIDDELDDYLDAICRCDFEIQLLRPGIPQPSVTSEPEEELELEDRQLQPIASSDAHWPKNVGLYGVEFPYPVTTERQLAMAIRQGDFKMFVDGPRVKQINTQLESEISLAQRLMNQGYSTYEIRDLCGFSLSMLTALKAGQEVQLINIL